MLAIHDAITKTPKPPPTPPLFLLPNFTFVIELLVFLLVLWFMGRSVVPKLRKAMTERTEHQREELQAAEVARSWAAEADEERRRVLHTARAEARSLVDAAGVEAESVMAHYRQRGEQERDALVEEGRRVVASERQRALEMLSDQVDELGVLAAARVLAIEHDGVGPLTHQPL